VEKSGDLWSLVEIPGNCRKYHQSVQDQTHFPRVSPKGPPWDPLRAYAGDFWDYLGYLWGMSEEVYGTPRDLGNSPDIWDQSGINLGFSWNFLVWTCWLRCPRWDYLRIFPNRFSWMVLDSLGSPEKIIKS